MLDFLLISTEILVAPTGLARSVEYGRSGIIKGTVFKQGIQIPCRVRLYEKSSGLKVSETLTDASGRYYFANLEKIRFFLVAHDPVSQFNAVIQDNVVPK